MSVNSDRASHLNADHVKVKERIDVALTEKDLITHTMHPC